MLICRSRGGTGILQATIFLLVLFCSPAAPWATTGVQRHRKTPSEFASELTNDTLTKTLILQALENSQRTHVDSDTSRAGLACSISKILFSKVNNTTEGYVDVVDGTGYTNRTNAYWFAVRSGGHNPNPTWASIGANGLLVDLYQLNTIRLSNNSSILTVGPGNRWGDVYRYLNGTGVSVAGARVPEVGVGGQLLGGGLSYFPSISGLSCDSLRSVEVVLGNGSVVTASAQANADLFASLKGGGGNLGIVTSFDLYTTAQDRVWFELNLYAAAQIPQLLAALVEYEGAAEQDSKAGLIFSPTPNLTAVGFTSVVQWSDGAFDQMAHAAVSSLGQKVTDLARARNLSLPFLNPNDATFSQNPLSSFGPDGLAQLKAASAKYDPLGVFQSLQNGGFLLSRMRET
ncbi:MAG: hypothetical protein Q9207_007071 [Kuettlingeria erythrocarpa]